MIAPEKNKTVYTEKNLLVNFTFFIRKFIIFIGTLDTLKM